ncbi:RNA polymerase sigma-I factor [Tepidibacillus fermentans]|uniref:RNA polymerase sigma factor SigI n=1 Tax=Tepidibacillus fermentans TaxID=1281767 RepID=A0A4R3K8Q9_9BACI|nr:RNA polymerase sigma-I factor [Tepidibacillus fermentans]TCS79404.1 RNA polymerase sigma factor [Tepidibacillus fermentans]
MIFRRFFNQRDQAQVKTNNREQNLEEIVALIQSGDHVLRNQIIKEYQPFIIKTSSKVCKRYIDPNQDDEYSIALSAFNEAIDFFQPEQNRSFLTFADTVIKRRLIDYIRRESKYLNQIPMTMFDIPDEEEHVINFVEVKQSIDVYHQQQQREERKEEIIRYTKEIAKYGITLSDLVKFSPKHQDTRENLFQIADILANDQELVGFLLETKTLPIKGLLSKVAVSRKTLERNRKYLIALAIIKIYDFHHLKAYLQVDREKRVGK